VYGCSVLWLSVHLDAMAWPWVYESAIMNPAFIIWLRKYYSSTVISTYYIYITSVMKRHCYGYDRIVCILFQMLLNKCWSKQMVPLLWSSGPLSHSQPRVLQIPPNSTAFWLLTKYLNIDCHTFINCIREVYTFPIPTCKYNFHAHFFQYVSDLTRSLFPTYRHSHRQY
jgi:hypothetical protein